MLDLLVLTLFLLARTFLSIHISTVNGGIVNRWKELGGWHDFDD